MMFLEKAAGRKDGRNSLPAGEENYMPGSRVPRFLTKVQSVLHRAAEVYRDDVRRDYSFRIRMWSMAGTTALFMVLLGLEVSPRITTCLPMVNLIFLSFALPFYKTTRARRNAARKSPKIF